MIVAMASLALLTALIFRKGKIIVLEMIFLIQIAYFSLGYVTSFSPIVAGLLPLRWLTGIFSFSDVESHL